MTLEDRVKKRIRTIENFPRPGIDFKDITSLFLDPQLVKDLVDDFAEKARELNPTAIVGIESRGFLLGPSIAQALDIPFILVRKRGKLPGNTITQSYDLEYGSATIEMHSEDISEGDRIIIHDDILATGGTASAAASLIEHAGGEVAGCFFLIHLTYLNGYDRVEYFSDKVYSTLEY